MPFGKLTRQQLLLIAKRRLILTQLSRQWVTVKVTMSRDAVAEAMFGLMTGVNDGSPLFVRPPQKRSALADVTALVNIILGKPGAVNSSAADINGDGSVTIADVTALVNIILGKK